MGIVKNADWFDHYAKLGDAVVVDPYDLSDASLRDLLAFADRYDLNINVSPTSYHYPSRTLAVFLTRREEARAA